MARKIWTHAELTDLFHLRTINTHKVNAGLYGLSESAMQRRQDRNPVTPEYRVESHKEYHAQYTKNGYCTACGCLYKEDLK